MGRTKRSAMEASDAERFLISQMFQCQQFLASRSIAPGFNTDPDAFEAAVWPLLHKKDKSRKFPGTGQSTLGVLDFSSPTPPNKRPRLGTEPSLAAPTMRAEADDTGPSRTSTPAEPPTAQGAVGVRATDQNFEPSHLTPSTKLKTISNELPASTPNQHMHQLLQLIERQQRHLRAKEGVSPIAPPQVTRAETGGGNVGQSDPRLLDLQRALLYASAARFRHQEGAEGRAESEPSKLVDAIQALIRAKEASSHLTPVVGGSAMRDQGRPDGSGHVARDQGVPLAGGEHVRDRVALVAGVGAGRNEGTEKSAQLHQLQRVLPQLTPATLSSYVGRLEAQREAAFRQHQPR
ncbi:hypothetical protein KFL_003110130 [Klebsormidium nitens]|uniref:Uncharacterized protein n=1 Tax=Klebsormidium nitens TaxID=105231 RepID=A0A1Y1ICJ1_KLENI|nr:hypothetical protein KFL_003110130 [Klebsormidium nitens]|eukprot:GAQ86791.1 hypothetical protein KFL_003110130 [Klebsormidium nitens]